MFRKNGRDIILERIDGSVKVSSVRFSVLVVGKEGLAAAARLWTAVG